MKRDRKPTISHPWNLVAAIAVCELAGLIGAVFTASAIPTWYTTLAKPAFNPPGWVFGPVWTVLYALMGMAVYLIWELGVHQQGVRQAVWLFGVHLVFNAAWSIIFFGFQAIGAALLEIVMLWGMIIAVTVSFYRLDKHAAYLLVPYWAWVSFATVLNFSIWVLNR